MKNIASSLIVASAVQSVAFAAPAGQDESLTKRLENGLGRTPALGYNNWVNIALAEITIQGKSLSHISRTMEAVHTPPRTQLSKSLIS
jgi:hypothetical protein